MFPGLKRVRGVRLFNMAEAYMRLVHEKHWKATKVTEIPELFLNFIQNSEEFMVSSENGERIFTTRDYNKSTCFPCAHCVVYVCQLPKACTEDEIYNFFTAYGQICEIRLMIDRGGWSRGYGFVTFANSRDACNAVRNCDGKSLYGTNFFKVRVSHSLGPQLLICGIPTDITELSVTRMFRERLRGVTDVFLPRDLEINSLNRGYAFVKFESYEIAASERIRIWYQEEQLWGPLCLVEWATPTIRALSDEVSESKIYHLI